VKSAADLVATVQARRQAQHRQLDPPLFLSLAAAVFEWDVLLAAAVAEFGCLSPQATDSAASAAWSKMEFAYSAQTKQAAMAVPQKEERSIKVFSSSLQAPTVCICVANC